MLSFTSSLTNAFKRDNFQGYWLFKLYYGNESAFTGVSDIPKEKGGDKYFGAMLGNTGLNQSCGIDSFRIRHGTMTLTIRNDLNSIEGLRFSDLYDSREYANRKWELIQGDEYATFSADNIIASGIISDKTPAHDVLTCTIYLDDWWIRYNEELPIARATKALYPNIPEKNIDKPIPMWYGDCDVESGIPAGSLWLYHRVKGRVPALVVDKGNVDENISCLPDTDQGSSVILNQLNDKNVFMYNQIYQACRDINVTLSTNPAVTANNLIKFTGNLFYVYVPIVRDTGDGTATITDAENIFDEDFDTSGNMAFISTLKTFIFALGEVKNTGALSSGNSMAILLYFGTFTGTPIRAGSRGNFYVYGIDQDSWNSLTWNGDSYQSKYVFTFFTDATKDSFDLTDKTIGIGIDALDGGSGSVDIKEIGLQLEIVSDKTYTQAYTEEYITANILGQWWVRELKKEREIIEAEMVFISGKGREYGSWIEDNGRSVGYSEGDLIENIVYIIEDILRTIETKLGLSPGSLVNTDVFDDVGKNDSGGANEGTLSNVFNDDVINIKFFFSQYILINARDLIYKLCKFSGLYFWWDANGKAKIRARKRTYSAVDTTIDYKKDIAFRSEENPSIPLIKSFKTPLSDVINYLTVKYNYDYGSNQTVKSSTPDDNANLKDDTSRDNYSVDSDYRKAIVDFRYTLDETTANNLGEAQIGWFKDRKNGVRFPALKPNLNALEYGDIVKFTNWDVNHKVWGETITSSMAWMVIEPMKNNNNAMIGVIRVPGSV